MQVQPFSNQTLKWIIIIIVYSIYSMFSLLEKEVEKTY